MTARSARNVPAIARSARPILSDRAGWLLPRLIVGGALAFVVAMVVLYWREQPRSFGFDFSFYRFVAQRWLDSGVYYVPYQLAGPYPFHDMVDNLYPPSALFLFVPATILPGVLWWIVPAAIVGYGFWTWRPAPWAWAAAALLMCWPKSYIAWIFGNTEIWVMAGVAGGLLWGWPAVVAFIKPVFAPFALVGIRRRSWWVVTVILAVVSLAMLPMWLDYLAAMRNLEHDALLFAQGVPLLLIPLVAWRGRA